jgi:hypothetical protein
MALTRVAVTTNATAQALLRGSRAEQAFARDAEKLARTQLRAAKAIMGTNAALDKLNGKTARAAGGTRALRAQTDRGGMSWLSTGKSLAFAAVGLGAVALGAISAGRSFVEAAGLADQFKTGLLALSKGDLTLSDNWEKELIRLRVPLEQGRADVIALLASFKGVANVNAGTTTNDILKLGSALRLTAEQSKSFNKVFKDVGGKGKIQREELVGQLGDVGIGVTATDFLAEVAKQQKISFEAAEKMLSTGKITAEMAIPALIKATQSARGITDLDAAADEAAGGTTGKLTAIDNRITKLKENLGAALVKAGFIEDLERLVSVLERVAEVGVRAYSAVRLLASEDTSIGKTLVQEVAPGGKAATNFADEYLAPIRARLESLTGNNGLFAPIGQSVGEGLAAGINASAGAAAAAATNLAAGVTDASKAELQIQSPSKAFAEQGRFIDEGLAMGIEEHQDLALASAHDVADGAIAEVELAAATGSGVNQTAMANVGAAAGNALASDSGASSGGSVGSVNVTINVDGSKDAQTTTQAIRSFFDTDFAALLERQLEGSGA